MINLETAKNGDKFKTRDSGYMFFVAKLPDAVETKTRFCLSDEFGEISCHRADGAYYEDGTRSAFDLVSEDHSLSTPAELTINGELYRRVEA